MFQFMQPDRVSDLHFKYDPVSGLRAIIAIHNTRFGPALGGCRFIHYASTEQAVTDAIRLAKGMSYKAVMAGIEQGGGKSVIIKPDTQFDPEALFSAFGHFVNELNGRYITAIDAGTTAHEMDIIRRHTAHVTSTTQEGNPSGYTAQGVLAGIQSAVKHRLGRLSLEGVSVALQGLGNVGFLLAEMLHEAGARLTVSDLDQSKVKAAMERFGAMASDPDAIYQIPCDVFSPCGLGGVINQTTTQQLRCSVVAGSANNQLARPEDGNTLFERHILYAPDYVINAGGLIYASLHHRHAKNSLINSKINHIAHTLEQIFDDASSEHCPTSQVADRMAESRLYGY